MKKFTVPCDFGGSRSPFTIYIGEPEPQHHPLHFQSEWLSKNRGGVIPGEVMDSISKLFELSKKNNVSFEELCVYALSNDDVKNGGQSEPPPPPSDEPPPPAPE
jgi:hypothetical protein